MRESRSNDLFILARVALQVAIRDEADVGELLLDPPVQRRPLGVTMSALPRKANITSAVRHVG